MYVLALNDSVKTYPYSIGQLLKDNPRVSFPKKPSDGLLAKYNVYPVTPSDQPEYDRLTQRVVQYDPILVEGKWTQLWDVIDLTEEEVKQRLKQETQRITRQRIYSYQQEADPLFFKWQAGESGKEEWESKRTEIKQRYQYPGE